ncbi:hypothetical protein ACSDQ9_10145 [Aestuariimicrobium soli]|uniref:hypothetical protein n=1 Tax=Aestuariimicrobium soli TaxID=2035834 RepID=UPI003EB7B706
MTSADPRPPSDTGTSDTGTSDTGNRLTRLVPDDLPPVDVEAALRAGRRSQRSHRLIGGGLGAVGVAAVAVVTMQLLPTTTSVPALPGGPGSPSASTASTPTSASCPQPDDTWQLGMPSYVDGVSWDGGVSLVHDHGATGTVGALVGIVPCNIVEIQDAAQRVFGGPWPDGSSTNLPVGTRLYRDTSRPEGCALMAQRDGVWIVFVKQGC